MKLLGAACGLFESLLGAVLERFWTVLRLSEALLERSWALLGRLGALLGRLGALLGRLGALLDRLGALLGRLGGLLELSWAVLGASWAVLSACRRRRRRRRTSSHTQVKCKGFVPLVKRSEMIYMEFHVNTALTPLKHPFTWNLHGNPCKIGP